MLLTDPVLCKIADDSDAKISNNTIVNGADTAVDCLDYHFCMICVVTNCKVDNTGKAVVVVLLFYVHGKHLRSCRDGQLT